MRSIWKTLKQEKPKNFYNIYILTRSNEIVQGFYCSETKKFYNRFGLVKPVSCKRWCYVEELVSQVLEEIKEIS